MLDHASVDELPDAILAGTALNVIVGAGVDVTVTLTVRVTERPLPEHRSVKVLVALSGPTFSLPEVARLPVQAPDAEQRVALVVDQLSCDCPLAEMLAGVALNDSDVRDAASAAVVPISSKQPIRNR